MFSLFCSRQWGEKKGRFELTKKFTREEIQ